MLANQLQPLHNTLPEACYLTTREQRPAKGTKRPIALLN